MARIEEIGKIKKRGDKFGANLVQFGEKSETLEIATKSPHKRLSPSLIVLLASRSKT